MMGTYIAQFMVYTAAMVGLIFAALLVYKKVSEGCGLGKKSEFLSIEESISLSARKNLYVIRAGNEKFLVASDIDRTSLIAKLDMPQKKSDIKPEVSEIKSCVDDLPSIVDFKKNNKPSVIRKMVNGLKTTDIEIVE